MIIGELVGDAFEGDRIECSLLVLLSFFLFFFFLGRRVFHIVM